MNFRSLFLFGFMSVSFSYAPVSSAQEARIFDCIRFAENGNDLIVDSDCVVRELRNGADPNYISRAKGRPISTLSHFVEMVGLSRDPRMVSAGTEAVQTLIGAGAKLQPVDAGILFWPISQGQVSLVRILLELGANAIDWPKRDIGTALTPVETAAAEGNSLIVDLLVKYGATRPNAKSALQERFVRSAKFSSIEELASLLTQGATVNGKSQDNEVALINALWSIGVSDCKTLPTIRWLLEKGADANLEGKGVLGTAPPLHHLVWFIGSLSKAKRETVCSEQILRVLIKHGARVAGRDSTGQTPLHIAAQRNSMTAARLLLESGSTVMPRDEKGRTPLDMAEASEMIKVLKRHGATER